MSQARLAVAMDGRRETALLGHLIRSDGDEDLCFATWRPSTGRRRRTAIVIDPVLPEPGERRVHGNASFESRYALRAAKVAARLGAGLMFVHCHPGGGGWQALNGVDARAEASIANLARALTGLPLVGMTLAGRDRSWSARAWDRGAGRNVACTSCGSVRVIGSNLRLSLNDDLRPRPPVQPSQERTVHAWGDKVQADLARLRILVVGAGSVGLHVVESLARTGVEHVAVMDFDRVEFLNLDRLSGATLLDALLRRPKIEVARRILAKAATAVRPVHELLEASVCEPAALETLLDFDVIFSCVDRPWPRHVLNTVAYSDLIPVVDGGLRLEAQDQGGMRNAYWRSHVVTAGRPCLYCIGQYDPGDVQLERDGSLDDPTYIAGLPPGSHLRVNQNVSALSIAAASALLNQFLSLVVAPSGIGDPGPLRHRLATHRIDHIEVSCVDGCPYAESVGDGDRRIDPTGSHPRADRTRAADSRYLKTLRNLVDWTDGALLRGSTKLARLVRP